MLINEILTIITRLVLTFTLEDFFYQFLSQKNRLISQWQQPFRWNPCSNFNKSHFVSSYNKITDLYASGLLFEGLATILTSFVSS